TRSPRPPQGGCEQLRPAGTLLSWFDRELDRVCGEVTVVDFANHRQSSPLARGNLGRIEERLFADVTGPERRHVAESVAVIRSAGRRTFFADLERARQLLCGAGLGF